MLPLGRAFVWICLWPVVEVLGVIQVPHGDDGVTPVLEVKKEYIPVVDVSGAFPRGYDFDYSDRAKFVQHWRVVRLMKEAIETYGFCKIKGHTRDDALWDRMWQLGHKIFEWDDRRSYLTTKYPGFPLGLADVPKQRETVRSYNYYFDQGKSSPFPFAEDGYDTPRKTDSQCRLVPDGEDDNEFKDPSSKRWWKDAMKTQFPHRYNGNTKWIGQIATELARGSNVLTPANERNARTFLQQFSPSKRSKTLRTETFSEDMHDLTNLIGGWDPLQNAMGSTEVSRDIDHSLYNIDDLNQYYTEFAAISELILRLLWEGLGRPEDLNVDDLMRDHWGVQRFLDYPRMTEAELREKLENEYCGSGKRNEYVIESSDAVFNHFRMPAHADFGLITILRQDSVGGLEVINSEKTREKMYRIVDGREKITFDHDDLQIFGSLGGFHNLRSVLDQFPGHFSVEDWPERLQDFWKKHGVYEEVLPNRPTKNSTDSDTEELVVNIGQIWSSYTKGSTRATVHRVMPKMEETHTHDRTLKRRNSHVFFLNPNWVRTKYGPLKMFGGEGLMTKSFSRHMMDMIYGVRRLPVK